MSWDDKTIRPHSHGCAFCGAPYDCLSFHVTSGYMSKGSEYRLMGNVRCCPRCRDFNMVESVRLEITA